MKPKEEEFPGYPLYPENEDIFRKDQVEPEIDPENIMEVKIPPPMPEDLNEQNADIEMPLDVPGAELDDDQEFIGTEDEENNYYSLGGDNHENLEEDQGD